MTRDIADRLRMFINQDWLNEFRQDFNGRITQGAIRASMRERMRAAGNETISDTDEPWRVKRIALTIEQIEQYQPPANYAKVTDARYERYLEQTGLTDSWELDALDPAVMEELIQDEIDLVRDDERFATAEFAQERDRAVLVAVKDNWATIRSVHAPTETGGET